MRKHPGITAPTAPFTETSLRMAGIGLRPSARRMDPLFTGVNQRLKYPMLRHAIRTTAMILTKKLGDTTNMNCNGNAWPMTGMTPPGWQHMTHENANEPGTTDHECNPSPGMMDVLHLHTQVQFPMRSTIGIHDTEEVRRHTALLSQLVLGFSLLRLPRE
jgi:hypothetical protein